MSSKKKLCVINSQLATRNPQPATQLNFRIFVEKRPDFNIDALLLLEEINPFSSPCQLTLFTIYDIFNFPDSTLPEEVLGVFCDPVSDLLHYEIKASSDSFATEYLPGQFDQRANSAQQCLQLLGYQSLRITSGKLIKMEGVSSEEVEKIKKYCINTVDSREKDLSKLALETYNKSTEIEYVDGFIVADKKELIALGNQLSFALEKDDLLFIQQYFISINRNPTLAELKVLDTYWSDHCRHTTFLTHLKKITFKGPFKQTVETIFEKYISHRKELGIEHKPITLMDLATINAKYLRSKGQLDKLVISDEINACTVEIVVDNDGKAENWLLLFKNETHNHPTEIEPYGGASTCVGGAIRDPLSGRAYVYQAMRITGAGNPLAATTLKGKIPQKKLTKLAAKGFSAYGNQIGLATTHVAEIYDEDFIAKRMEVGMVVGAVKADYVRREKPLAGDLIILLGGKTGRDGCGGASGSSKQHHTDSVETLGAEVQKGNPIEERKIQRLFRNPAILKLIKKCNDFGAGGVSVAIGELSDGVFVDLDKIPTKYAGLSDVELSISESQERMAVVIDNTDKDRFIQLAIVENVKATVVGHITDNNKLVFVWKGEKVVDIDRKFLDTNGVRKSATVAFPTQNEPFPFNHKEFTANNFNNKLTNLNCCSQKGLVSMFDASIGAGTALMPLGGKYQRSPQEGSVQKIPTFGYTKTVSIATWGYSPKLSKWSPMHGGVYAVVESVAKVVALGGDYRDIYLSFQEYFKKLGNNPENWSQPLAALLGAFEAQNEFQLAAIGGKDSMSGTYDTISVPPTLISFAVATAKVDTVTSSEFKKAGNYIYLVKHDALANKMPDFEQLKTNFSKLSKLIFNEKIIAAKCVGEDGLAVALFKMAIGNNLGVKIDFPSDQLLTAQFGAIIIESTHILNFDSFQLLGKVTNSDTLVFNNKNFSLKKLLKIWEQPLESVFPTRLDTGKIPSFKTKQKINNFQINHHLKPKVIIPIFPGTNCEYDAQKAFKSEGLDTAFIHFNNQSSSEINQSIKALAKAIESANILFLAGGFSAGDEPDGSAKYISAVLRNELIKEKIHQLLAKDFLILGICNGFQALIKTGLLPIGSIGLLDKNAPTLAVNSIGRHISQMVRIRLTNNSSPWLCGEKIGSVFTLPVSHGEGRFYCSTKMGEQLLTNGQVATQYVDFDNKPTMDIDFNPNGSILAIEGITDSTGKIYGRMAHCERFDTDLYKNIEGVKQHNIFKNALNYFGI